MNIETCSSAVINKWLLINILCICWTNVLKSTKCTIHAVSKHSGQVWGRGVGFKSARKVRVLIQNFVRKCASAKRSMLYWTLSEKYSDLVGCDVLSLGEQFPCFERSYCNRLTLLDPEDEGALRPSKHWGILAQRHDFTSKKTRNIASTAMRIKYLALCETYGPV